MSIADLPKNKDTPYRPIEHRDSESSESFIIRRNKELHDMPGTDAGPLWFAEQTAFDIFISADG